MLLNEMSTFVPDIVKDVGKGATVLRLPALLITPPAPFETLAV